MSLEASGFQTADWELSRFLDILIFSVEMEMIFIPSFISLMKMHESYK